MKCFRIVCLFVSVAFVGCSDKNTKPAVVTDKDKQDQIDNQKKVNDEESKLKRPANVEPGRSVQDEEARRFKK